MKTVNSLSGGKTSSYIAANYPADYDVFALVRTDDKNCLFPDKKLRQEVEDRIQKPFIGTLEDDTIIHTMFDLEQFTGRKITWVSSDTFDSLTKNNSGTTYIPNVHFRFCTDKMKVRPIAEWWYKEIGEPVEMRIGFRANETNRALSMINRLNENGLGVEKIRVEINENKNDKWKELEWRKPVFPLIEDQIYKDKIEIFWKDKPVRFAWMNNCVGCFHKNPALLSKQSQLNKNKFQWFIEKEEESIKDYGRKWYNDQYGGITYKQISNWKPQIELFENDFNECDSGYCGL